jgi:NADH-quinone oxidoreductase subunit G
MKGKKVVGLVGDLAPVEAAYSLKLLVEGLGGMSSAAPTAPGCRRATARPMSARRRIEDIDTAKTILLIGTNPRVEAPVLNARIRKAWTKRRADRADRRGRDLTYDYKHMGTDRAALTELVGRVTAKPDTLVILGQGALNEADGEAVLSQAMAYAEGAGGKLLVLHTAAGRVGAMDVGAVTEGGLAMATEGRR